MIIVAYEKARALLEQIERQQLEVESRLKVIEQLKVDLNKTSQEGDARGLRSSIVAAPVASEVQEAAIRPSTPSSSQPTAPARGQAKRGVPV